MTATAASQSSHRTQRLAFAALALALLSIPAVAMFFTSEVNWGPGDFVVMGGLLIALYAGIELALRLARTPLGRTLAVLASILAFLTIWAELAVGIFH